MIEHGQIVNIDGRILMLQQKQLLFDQPLRPVGFLERLHRPVVTERDIGDR